MNQEIYNKIDEIFSKLPNDEISTKFKSEIEFNIKKLYNQMLQSGFSEYIAVAECLDNLTKFSSLIGEETDVDKIKLLINKEKELKENIKNTTSTKELSDDYDKESIDKIIQLVEGAALEKDNLSQTEVVEQSDEIVYKKQDENKTMKEDNGTKNTFDKKIYFKRLFTFIGTLLATAIVIIIIHFTI